MGGKQLFELKKIEDAMNNASPGFTGDTKIRCRRLQKLQEI